MLYSSRTTSDLLEKISIYYYPREGLVYLVKAESKETKNNKRCCRVDRFLFTDSFVTRKQFLRAFTPLHPIIDEKRSRES